MKKNVLIISYSYPPANAPAAQRPYALAKYLNKSKYNITVITCSNADSSLGFDDSFNEELEGAKLIKIPSKYIKSTTTFRASTVDSQRVNTGFKQKIKNIIFKLGSQFILPDKAVFWLYNVKRFLRNDSDIISSTDVVFTTSPLFSNHLIGLYLKNHNNKVKWIADFRDFHYVENQEKRGRVISNYHKKLEYKIMKNVDVITFISSAMQQIYKSHYINYKDKMNHIYNGYDSDDFKDLIIESVNNKKLTIFYAGSFYRGIRSPYPLLELLDIIIEKGYLKLDEIAIKVAGNFEHELLEEAKSFNSFACIKFLGKLPRTEVLKQLTKADLLWLIVGDKITHYTGIPIKFYEYLAARRPIINFAPSQSEPTKIIKEYNLGISIDTNRSLNKGDIVLFNKMISDFKDGALSKPLDEKLIGKFTRNKQALQFEKIIDG